MEQYHEACDLFAWQEYNSLHEFIDQVISIQLDHKIDKECATHHYDSLKLSFMLEIAFNIILVREDRSEWPLQF